MPFIPHTPKDTQNMLERIGVSTIDELFDEIPASLRAEPFRHIPEGLNEMQMLEDARELAFMNHHTTCFIGAGSYDHHIPAAVWDIASRGEFLTAYTPYQAEASQGTLQLLYEFQTMIAELTGMDVSNASMYDGATALAEAVLMAARLKKNQAAHKILVMGTLHPHYRETLETIIRNQHIEMITLPFDEDTGITSLESLERYINDDITALIINQPNFFGCLEDVDALCNIAAQHQMLTIACVNPVSLSLLKPPGQWGTHGVDITCGEGQPLGSPMSFGGPYFGFLSAKMTHVRQMPGRIIGRTVDKDGQIGYTLTLQAREQHIRRAKATSNICTNQGLLVTAATIHMSLLGAEGLYQVAAHSHANTRQLIEGLCAIPGVQRAFSSPIFHEALLTLNKDIDTVLHQLREKGIAGGYSVMPHYPQLRNSLLVCATEMRTEAEIQHYITTLADIMR